MSQLASRLASGRIPRATSAASLAGPVLRVLLFSAASFFIIMPLAWIVLLSFAGNFTFPSLWPASLTLAWWRDVVTSPGLVHSMLLSLEIAPVVLVLSAVICLPAAYAIGRFNFIGKRLVLLSVFSINAFPRISLYIAMIPMLFLLNLMGTAVGVVIVQLIATVLFMTWIPATGFAAIPEELVNAARDAGASRRQIFFRVLLPLARPSITVAAVLSFLAAFDEAQGTFLVGAPHYITMPVQMYSLVLDYPLGVASVFAVILSVPSVVLLLTVRHVLFGAGTSSPFHLR